MGTTAYARMQDGLMRRRLGQLTGLLAVCGGLALAQQPPAALSGVAGVGPSKVPSLPPVVPAPGPGMLVVSCDPGGCWDEFGMRYDRADAGVFVRRDGRSCLAVKGRMRCE